MPLYVGEYGSGETTPVEREPKSPPGVVGSEEREPYELPGGPKGVDPIGDTPEGIDPIDEEPNPLGEEPVIGVVGALASDPVPPFRPFFANSTSRSK